MACLAFATNVSRFRKTFGQSQRYSVSFKGFKRFSPRPRLETFRQQLPPGYSFNPLLIGAGAPHWQGGVWQGGVWVSIPF